MIRLVCVWLLFLAYAAFALYLSAIVPPKPIPVVIVPYCADPRPGEADFNPCSWIPFAYNI